MKPNLKFLQKVAEGGVMSCKGYTMKRGGYWTFVGGKETAEKHATAGLINMPGSPDLGRPSKATLTDAGRAVLEGRSHELDKALKILLRN